MERRAFLAALASLLLLLPRAAPSDLPPPAPAISVSPRKARFLIGDAVSIACAAPPAAGRVQAFRFSGTSGWVRDVRTARSRFVHTFNVTGPRDGGFHTCSYAVLRPGGRVVRSADSPAALIDVRDRPTPPNLTVTPSSLTVAGQPLLFTCSAPPGAARRRFGFFQEDLEVTDGVLEGSGDAGARLRVERSDRNRTGNFSCRYEELTEGRWIASYASHAVRVEVKGPCPAPVLSVQPPSGVVAAGHRLLLVCSAPRRHFRLRFRFYRDGAEVTPGGDVGGGDVSGDVGSGDVGGEESELLFPRVSPESAGNFSCRVEEEVGGAWLEAPPSEGVAVVVSAEFELLPLVVGVSVGVASLLLALLLAVWLCRRRRGGSRWRGLRPGDDCGAFSMADLQAAS